MATTPNMGLTLDNYIGQSNPTGPALWASHLEAAKNLIDSHTHGPNSLVNGAALFLQQSYANGSSTIPNPTIATPTYTIALVTTSAGAANITLPLAAVFVDGVIIIQDTGSAATHAITVTCAGADKINGASTATISANYGTLRLFAQVAGQWYII